VTPFAWDEPKTLRQAIAALDPDDASVRPIAGGTALMLMMKTGVFAPTRLVSLAKIEPKYSEIRINRSGGLRIGAMVSLSALEQSADVAKHSGHHVRCVRSQMCACAMWPTSAMRLRMAIHMIAAASGCAGRESGRGRQGHAPDRGGGSLHRLLRDGAWAR
jgi:hypothetical protein